MRIKSDLVLSFSGLKVKEIKFHELVNKQRDPGLDILRQIVQSRIRSSIVSLDEVRDQKVIRAYRDFTGGRALIRPRRGQQERR
ncbi:MAG: hypothetical protein ACYC7D_02390 [Nitrososphaerales archaeon]